MVDSILTKGVLPLQMLDPATRARILAILLKACEDTRKFLAGYLIYEANGSSGRYSYCLPLNLDTHAGEPFYYGEFNPGHKLLHVATAGKLKDPAWEETLDPLETWILWDLNANSLVLAGYFHGPVPPRKRFGQQRIHVTALSHDNIVEMLNGTWGNAGSARNFDAEVRLSLHDYFRREIAQRKRDLRELEQTQVNIEKVLGRLGLRTD